MYWSGINAKKSIRNLPFKYLLAISVRSRTVLYWSSGLNSNRNYTIMSTTNITSKTRVAIKSIESLGGSPNAAISA